MSSSPSFFFLFFCRSRSGGGNRATPATVGPEKPAEPLFCDLDVLTRGDGQLFERRVEEPFLLLIFFNFFV